MIRTYIDWVLDVPWSTTTEDRLDPVAARQVLDEDHYDLDKVKERIVEYLAVQKLKARQSGALLAQGPDPLLRRPARRRQDLARTVDRARDEPEVRPHLARRRARRGRDPRPSPHLHRRHSRPHRAGAEAGGRDEPGVHARRDRQDQRRLPGRSGGGAARGARPGAEPFVPRSLPRDQHRSLARAVHRDLEPARHDPPGAARSHGDHLARRLQRGGEAAHRAALSRAAAARGARPRRASRSTFDDAALRRIIAEYTREAGVRSLERQIGAVARKIAARIATRAGSTTGPDAPRPGAACTTARPPRLPRSAALPGRCRVPRVAAGRRDRRRVDRDRRRRAVRRGQPAAGRPPQSDPHRAARQRDAGVGARGGQPHPRLGAASSASLPSSSTRTICTSTSRPARFRRTARRPASPWRPRSSRRCGTRRCARTSR